MPTARENIEQSPTFNRLQKFALSDGEVSTLETPKEFCSDVLQQIANAEHRIWISALYIENDASGNAILNSLKDAKERNPELEIKIFVDFHRNQRARIGEKGKKTAVDAFKEILGPSGVEIFGVPVAKTESGGVLHTKGIVIDDTLTFSGASFNNVYLHGKDEKGQEKYRVDRYWKFKNRDLANSFVKYLQKVFDESEAIQSFKNGKVEIAEETRAAIENLQIRLSETNFPPPENPTGAEAPQTYAVPIAGFGKDNPLSQTIVDLINAAEKNVTIYTPYFNLSEKVRNAIADALERGVDVDIVSCRKVANDFYRNDYQIAEDSEKDLNFGEKARLFGFDGLPYFYEQNLRKFIEEFQEDVRGKLPNVYLWEDDENTFHPKGVVVDGGEITLVTGHNINQRGDTDPENGVIVVTSDEEILKMTEDEKQNLLQNTKLVNSSKELPHWTGYPIRVIPPILFGKFIKSKL